MALKEIYSNIIPFEGIKAMTIWPWVFIRTEYKGKFYSVNRRHENTHGLQQIECFIVGLVLSAIMLIWDCGWYSLIPLGFFYELYVLDWMLKLPIAFFANKSAYCSICFEQEAYEHEWEMDYNFKKRKHFEWLKYIFKLRKRHRITLEEYEKIKAEDGID